MHHQLSLFPSVEFEGAGRRGSAGIAGSTPLAMEPDTLDVAHAVSQWPTMPFSRHANDVGDSPTKTTNGRSW